MISRGELKGDVLGVLGRTARHPGAYTPIRVEKAIQEAMDYVATEMIFADEGWQTELRPYATTAGQLSLELAGDIALVKQVRYLIGDTYMPMVYDDGSNREMASDDSASRQAGNTYKMINNALYFNPALSDGAEKGLQVEVMLWPARMIDDNEMLPRHVSPPMRHFLKYKAASILATTVEKMVISWASEQTGWEAKMMNLLPRRNLQPTAIREYEG